MFGSFFLFALKKGRIIRSIIVLQFLLQFSPIKSPINSELCALPTVSAEQIRMRARSVELQFRVCLPVDQQPFRLYVAF